MRAAFSGPPSLLPKSVSTSYVNIRLETAIVHTKRVDEIGYVTLSEA